jgi:protein-tyrosine phosphatase
MENFSEILPNLYIGNYKAAKDKDFFKTANIKAVLNCTKDVPNHFRCSSDIEYLRIPVDDSLMEKDIDLMKKFLPIAIEFIHKHVDIQNECILVNCVEGKQRSVICVLGYLMQKKKKSKSSAYNHILRKRPQAFHNGSNINFERSLG